MMHNAGCSNTNTGQAHLVEAGVEGCSAPTQKLETEKGLAFHALALGGRLFKCFIKTMNQHDQTFLLSLAQNT